MAQSTAKLSLPRVLCLHGGGSNSEILTAQLRAFIRHLPGLRFVFADGPFASPAGPNVLPTYEAFGPYRRWMCWQPDQPTLPDDEARDQILASIRKAQEADPGTGPWVAILGFSQGAGVAASLLYDQQIRTDAQDGAADPTYKFAVLFAARSPLTSFSPASKHEAFTQPGGYAPDVTANEPIATPLRIPTIHIEGMYDPDIRWQRRLVERYCDRRTAKLFVWEGDHRIPFLDEDVLPVVEEIYRMARGEGVYLQRS